MNYAQILIKASQMLQDVDGDTYDTIELGLWIEDARKEFSKYDPHIVDVTFKIESRTGTATSDTSLTDTTKDQFVAGDATQEKVVHNTTDNTFAVVLVNSSASVNTLSADIMDDGDNYRIYNKRCKNEKQIFIGDVSNYLWIDSVEYPLGQKRNWKVYGQVLEIDVDSVADSNSVLDPPNNIDVLVRFAKPHILCSLADLVGAVKTTAISGATSMGVYNFTDTEVIVIGDEFYIADQKNTHSITLSTTMTNQTGSGKTIYFYPSLEADATADDGVTFIGSTFKSQHEELFVQLVVARALMSEANAQLIQAKADLTTGRALVNTINKGGAGTSVATAYLAYARAGEELAREQRSMGERKLAEVIGKMEVLGPPRTKRSYTRA